MANLFLIMGKAVIQGADRVIGNLRPEADYRNCHYRTLASVWNGHSTFHYQVSITLLVLSLPQTLARVKQCVNTTLYYFFTLLLRVC